VRKEARLNIPSFIQTEVLIIGGGVTGTALARDLALRGVDCILVEKDDINAGASGRNHGLLHSGARYVAGDCEAAMECRSEGNILKRVAAQTIQDTGGYFVAVQGDDERYIADFPSHCARSGITANAVDVATARALEPALSEHTIAVFEVPDAAIDPFRLSLESLAQARNLGARLMRRPAWWASSAKDAVSARCGSSPSAAGRKCGSKSRRWSTQPAHGHAR